MSTAQHDALVALCGSAGGTFYDGLVPNRPPLPYHVLWTSGPRWVASRLCGTQRDVTDTTFATTCVALSAGDVAQVQQRLHNVLVDAQVTVAGRNVQRVKHVSSADADQDFDVDPPVVTVVDVWRLYTVPA